MKRTLLMVLLLLTGGAIINVAVAWGLAAWSSVIANKQQILRESIKPGAESVRGVRRAFGRLRIDQLVRFDDESIEPNENLVAAAVPFPEFPQYGNWSQDIAGLPFQALTCTYYGRIGIHTPERSSSFFGDEKVECGIRLPDSAHFSPKWRALPLKPIWPGFAINTVFYAAILWLLFASPGIVRRRIRARRGQCPACAYPVGASDVCTECGRPVKSRNAETQKAEMV